jgi:hypothetical protein
MMLYWNGFLAIFLGVNLVLFYLTAVHLWRQRLELRMAFSGANSRAQGQQEKDQIKMYLKLFLLMGFTSVNLSITYVLWKVLDVIDEYSYSMFSLVNEIPNFLRGPLIFWFCIWSRKNVRKAFLVALTCRRRKPNVQQTASINFASVDISRSGSNKIAGYSENSIAQKNARDLHLSF